MADSPGGKPIPILLMSHSLGHGGGERQLALTALAIDRNRFEPHVGYCEGGFWVDRLREAGIPFFVMGPRSLVGISALRETRRLRSYIRENRIRIAQTFDYSMNVLGIPAARSVPGVITIANLRCHMSLIPRRYRWLNLMAYRISPGTVVNSEALRRHLCEDYAIQARRVFTCHNGIDTGVFHPAPKSTVPGLEGASVVVGTVCVLRPEKNLGLLMEAFHDATRDRGDVRLLITGSGPEEPVLRALAERLGIAEKCIFHPSTPDVTRVLSAIDIFVLPSLSEGLSNALMEAMACGCCVIASNVGGNPELVADGVTGMLFPSRDRSALVEKLTEAIGDAGRRQALAAAGAEKMRREFSLTRAVENMEEIYETLLSRAAGRR
jgi:glycosyltransferase involved in cell wall biosynthesis